jgi:hypothetical protein
VKYLTESITNARPEEEQVKPINLINEAKKEHSNSRSWERCYSFFRKQRIMEDRDTYLCSLHLAFFLASFRMYQRSSKLPDKDCTIFDRVVELLMNDKYDMLWGLDVAGLKKREDDAVRLIFGKRDGLKTEISEILKGFTVSPTDTLVSKILLGTMCCSPGFDRYFNSGLVAYNNTEKRTGRLYFERAFNEDNFRTLIRFLGGYDKEEMDAFNSLYTGFDPLVLENGRKFHYPPMRVVDLYFWAKGYNHENKNNDKLLYENPLKPGTPL